MGFRGISELGMTTSLFEVTALVNGDELMIAPMARLEKVNDFTTCPDSPQTISTTIVRDLNSKVRKN
jgi:hypothetical protein